MERVLLGVVIIVFGIGATVIGIFSRQGQVQPGTVFGGLVVTVLGAWVLLAG